jgi:hypothetical protein
MIRVIAALLAAAGFCSSSCACEGDVQAWSARFLALKTLHGHFDGGPWIAEVDRFGGAKHELMRCLSAQAVEGHVDATQLLRWMGRPDETSAHPAVWIYRWRGAHDRLAFTLRDGHVVQADWLLALE